MRQAIAAFTAVVALVFVPLAQATVSVSVNPTSVDFGRVPFNGGCMVIGDVPNEFCVTRTVTITNTGSETLFGAGFRSCEQYFPETNSCFTLRADWGGFVSGGDPNTCIFGVVDPGESCTVVLVAFPSRPGLIRGFFVGEMATLTGSVTTILVVPVRLLSIPA
jgi:hypothetical protein